MRRKRKERKDRNSGQRFFFCDLCVLSLPILRSPLSRIGRVAQLNFFCPLLVAMVLSKMILSIRIRSVRFRSKIK